MKVKVDQDPEFQEIRQQQWVKIEDSIPDSPHKEDIKTSAAFKKWYLQGNLSDFLKLVKKYRRGLRIGFDELLFYCGTSDIDEFYRFAIELSDFYSKHGIEYWKESRKKNRDEKFIGHILSGYMFPSVSGHPVLYEHMWNELRPDSEGNVTFPIALGNDQWKPSYKIGMHGFTTSYFTRLREYLYSSEPEYYQHLKSGLSYLKWLPKLNPIYYSVVLLGDEEEILQPEVSNRPIKRVSQVIMRRVIGNLCGFKSSYDDYDGPLRHNDPEFEAEVKAFIDGLDMPPEYYDLVEFIKAHPEDYWKVSG